MVVHLFVEPVADLMAAGAADLLDDTERARADRVQPPGTSAKPQGRAERVRHGYIAGRALSRASASALVGVDPAAIDVRVTPAGKPALVGVGVAHSVSHTAGLVAVAVAVDPDGSLALGVDIESAGAPGRYLAIARRFFTPDEQASVESIEPSDPGMCVEPPAEPAQLHTFPGSAGDRFMQIWCRKEAVIKTLGLTVADMGRLATTDACAADDGGRRWEALLAGSTRTVTGLDLDLERAGVSNTLGALGVAGASVTDGEPRLEMHRGGAASALVAAVLSA